MSKYRKARWLSLIVLLCAPVLLSAQPIAPDRWIDDGWAVLDSKDGSDLQRLNAAIGVWQQGVMRLDPDRILLSPVGVYGSAINALHGVKRLGVELHGIVLKGQYHATISYFVLSVPLTKNLGSLRSHFEQLISGGKHPVYGWSASRFQAGGSMALALEHQQILHHSPLPSMVNGEKSEHGMVVQAQPMQRRATPEEMAQKLLLMAKKAQAQGDRKRAILLLTELLKRTPDYARARLMSGRLMVKDGQYDAAWQVMRPLLKSESLDWKPWFWSGTAELMVGQLNKAANQFDEALARDGRVSAVWVQRALVAQQRGRYKVAYQLLKVAEAQSPKSVQVMLNIGFTLDALGKRKAASDYYRRYLVHTAGSSSQWKARKAVLARLAALGR